jgi:hypothetical protein
MHLISRSSPTVKTYIHIHTDYTTTFSFFAEVYKNKIKFYHSEVWDITTPSIMGPVDK